MATERQQWNPRYVAYATAHGTPDPDAMLERDREAWPGGCMIGFSLWIQERWGAFATHLGADCCLSGGRGGRAAIYLHMGGPRGIRFPEGVSVDTAFDAWLAEQVGG